MVYCEIVFFGQDTSQFDFEIFRIKMYHDDTRTREQKTYTKCQERLLQVVGLVGRSLFSSVYLYLLLQFPKQTSKKTHFVYVCVQ